jgi:outer membrane cobalamin receptor
MSSDTTAADTVQTYEIPRIVTLWFHDETAYSDIRTARPVTGDHELIEVLFFSPFAILDFGGSQHATISRKGKDPHHSTLFLNGHRIDNPLFGYMDLSQLSAHPIDRIDMSDHMLGSECINIHSRVNQYDRPFSFVQFTWGDFGTNIYNLGFTRPITNDFGFYLSGSYLETDGYDSHSQRDLGSLYSNIYYNTIVPMRLDVTYTSGEYGVRRNTVDSLQATGYSDFADVSLVLGNDNHRTSLYYTVNHNDYEGISSDSLLTNITRNYGVDINNHSNFGDYTFAYQLMGVVSDVESELVGEHTVSSLNARVALQKSFKRLSLSLGARSEWYDERDWLHAPHVTARFLLADSARLSATISRDFRNPSLLELYGHSDVPQLYNWPVSNSSLVPEYMWVQELSFHWGMSAVTLYRHNYENMIAPCVDTEGNFTVQNIASWEHTGAEAHIVHTVHLTRDTSTQSNTAISAGLSGNYMFSGDSLARAPKSHVRGFITFVRETPRFGLRLTTRAEHVSTQQNRTAHRDEPFTVFSTVAHIRFVTLTFSVHFDNLVDDTYAYIEGYEMAPRSGRFSITWEFWD